MAKVFAIRRKQYLFLNPEKKIVTKPTQLAYDNNVKITNLFLCRIKWR